jgi:hypothetical protein
MALRMRRPETVRLALTDGDWVEVKKYLTAGERRQMFAGMLRQGVDGTDEVNTLKIGLSKIAAYLTDWSAKDADGKPVVIADRDVAAVTSAVDSLPPEAFTEVLAAIEAHETAMEAARSAEKNGQGGESTSQATSPSPASLAGDTSGSVN